MPGTQSIQLPLWQEGRGIVGSLSTISAAIHRAICPTRRFFLHLPPSCRIATRAAALCKLSLSTKAIPRYVPPELLLEPNAHARVGMTMRDNDSKLQFTDTTSLAGTLLLSSPLHT